MSETVSRIKRIDTNITLCMYSSSVRHVVSCIAVFGKNKFKRTRSFDFVSSYGPFLERNSFFTKQTQQEQCFHFG